MGFDVQISMSIMGFGLILADTGLMNIIVAICEFCVLWPCSVLETVFTWSSNSVGSYILSTTILKKTSSYIYRDVTYRDGNAKVLFFCSLTGFSSLC